MRDRIFDNLIGIQRDMLKILGEVSSITGNPIPVEEAIDEVWHPKCDVFQTDEDWIIIVELAGMKKDEINISITKEFIRIAGERQIPSSCLRNEPSPAPSCYYNMEIETGRFDRRIFFPDIALDKDNPRLSYDNGILRIVFKTCPQIERIIPID